MTRSRTTRVQPTSAEAHRLAEQSGALSGKRLEVARAFERFGPGTAAEVLKLGGLAGNLNLMRARVTELADAGRLRQGDSRKCTVTGRRAIVWHYERCAPRTKGPDASAIAEQACQLLEAILADSATYLAHPLRARVFDYDPEAKRASLHGRTP